MNLAELFKKMDQARDEEDYHRRAAGDAAQKRLAFEAAAARAMRAAGKTRYRTLDFDYILHGSEVRRESVPPFATDIVVESEAPATSPSALGREAIASAVLSLSESIRSASDPDDFAMPADFPHRHQAVS